jgi:hypothetical protein
MAISGTGPRVDRLTKRDWDRILDALNRVAADSWDEACYGPRPDWEALIARVQQRLQARPRKTP